jgi:Na+/proline symporter
VSPTAIGVWATKRTKTANDFFVAGSGIGLIALGISAMAATLSGFAFIGGPGLVYSMGFGALFIVLPAGLTNTMTAWALAKKLRTLREVRGVITIPDAIGARYRSRAAQGIAAIAIVIAIVGYMATNFLALGLVIDSIFGTGLAAGIWLGAVITLAYTVSGGILAGVYTDVFQGFVMAIASVLVFISTLKVGHGLSGISHTILSSDTAFLAPWGKISALSAISFFFVFGIGALGQPHVLHKFYMLKDPRRLKWYPALMTGALTMTLLLYFGVGLVVKALVVRGELTLSKPDDATPLYLLHFAPRVLAALVFAGVAAAIMSTVNSFMNIGAAAVTHDMPVALGKRVDNELLVGRISTVIISIVAALIAQYSGLLVAFLGLFGWGLFSATLAPALAIGFNWRGATRTGAVVSMSVSVIMTLLFESLGYFKVYKLPTGVSVSGLTLVTSFLLFFIVSRMTSDTNLDADIAEIVDCYDGLRCGSMSRVPEAGIPHHCRRE